MSFYSITEIKSNQCTVLLSCLEVREKAKANRKNGCVGQEPLQKPSLETSWCLRIQSEGHKDLGREPLPATLLRAAFPRKMFSLIHFLTGMATT